MDERERIKKRKKKKKKMRSCGSSVAEDTHRVLGMRRPQKSSQLASHWRQGEQNRLGPTGYNGRKQKGVLQG